VPAGLEVAQRTDDLVETSGTRLSLTDGALGAETTTELSVQVWPDPGPHEDLGAATTVGGRSGRLLASGDGASVVIGQREVVITLDGPRASRTELTRIAGAVQWASNPGDPTAWFDARTSVP
jgi:hypothetical protein